MSHCTLKTKSAQLTGKMENPIGTECLPRLMIRLYIGFCIQAVSVLYHDLKLIGPWEGRPRYLTTRLGWNCECSHHLFTHEFMILNFPFYSNSLGIGSLPSLLANLSEVFLLGLVLFQVHIIQIASSSSCFINKNNRFCTYVQIVSFVTVIAQPSFPLLYNSLALSFVSLNGIEGILSIRCLCYSACCCFIFRKSP